MENEQEVAELQENGTEGENEGTQEEIQEEKPKLTPEQLQGIKKRQFTKLAKELGIELPKPDENKVVEPATKKPGFDYAELAFHNSKPDTVKIVSDEDVEFLKQTLEETGKPQSSVLNSKWFQAELKERQEARVVKEAIPKGSKRSVSTNRDSADYWAAQVESGKVKLSDIPDVNIRREVLNKRIKSEEDGTKFAKKSVIIGGQQG